MQPLENVKVVSFNHYLMGPIGAQHLADLGAEVIAIEPPGGAFQRRTAIGGAFVGPYSVGYLSTGRNKRSIALDLKSESGRKVALELIGRADVLMENYRPGTMGRLGLGYEDVQSLNPGLIYASASGYGASGPYRDRPGQDLLLQSLTGLPTVTGRTGCAPVAVGASVIDHHGGALYALGILAALVERSRTGEGRRVEVSLLGAALDLQAEALTGYLNGARQGYPTAPDGMASWYAVPPYGIYATADGHITLSMGSVSEFAEALGIAALVGMSDEEAQAKRDEVVALIAGTLKEQPTAYWTRQLEARKLWFAPVNDYDDVAADPHIRHTGALIEAELADGLSAVLLRSPFTYDGASLPIRMPPQPLGAQTLEILAELGYAAEDIAALVGQGAVSGLDAGADLPR